MSATRIEALCKDLADIRDKCLGKDENAKKSGKKSNDFLGLKEQITVGLNDLAKSVAERNEIIATSGRNRQAVKLNMENQKKMDVLKDQWNLMKKLVDKEKRKGKGILGTKLTDEELQMQDDTLKLLETLMRDMEALFYKDKATGGNNRLASRAKAELDADRQARAQDAGKGGKGSSGDGGAGNDVEMQEISADEQSFMQAVQERDQQVDAKLDQVLQGVRVLRQIGEDIHTEIAMQGTLLKEIDIKVDKTTNKFKVANKQMKQLLEESGGLNRWCPIIIFVMVIVALAGYVMTSVGA